MIASILAGLGSVLATRGNLNNEIGLPLTLLRLQEQAYAVVELGASRAGEIGYLSRIAQPDVALINNAGAAHLEGFGSLEGVARAKGEIISGLAREGHFVFNADDAWAPLWRELAEGHPIRSFGSRQPADVWSPPGALELRWTEAGFVSRFPVTTPQCELEIEFCLAGEHNRMNALAAIAAAQLLGAEPEQMRAGFERLEPVKGRLQPLRGRDGISLIDDSYNANPDSVAAAIRVLATAPGRRFLVLGELAELGPGAKRLYREIAELARSAGIDRLYTVNGAGLAGECFGAGGSVFPSQARLIEGLQQDLRAGDRVLVKGSRRAGMERVIAALAEQEGG
jgi:UDP-N-acetylmuramoyl-tripeptide--D-alanyl-D-alanine ligase